MASTVSSIDPKEQLQAEMWSLGYVEVLFIYTIIHVNKLPSQACCSISEFFCFAGMMEIFSLATWRPALSAICGEGKGLEELDASITVPGVMCYALMRSRQEFFDILHRKLSSFFFLGSVFFLVFNHGLFSCLFFSIHDTQNKHKRKLGVNKSQVANVNKRKRSNMKLSTTDVLPQKTSLEALTLTHFNWLIALWRVIEIHLQKRSC